jgi:hypothetical protein
MLARSDDAHCRLWAGSFGGPGGGVTMPNWFLHWLLLVETITGEPQSDWEFFAGSIWAADTYEVTDRYQPADIAAARGLAINTARGTRVCLAVEGFVPVNSHAFDEFGVGGGALAVEAELASVAAFGDGAGTAELEVVPIGDGRVPGQVVIATQLAEFRATERVEDLDVRASRHGGGDDIACVGLGVREQALAGVEEGGVERLEVGKAVAFAAGEVVGLVEPRHGVRAEPLEHTLDDLVGLFAVVGSGDDVEKRDHHEGFVDRA